jgi:threonine aldolase
LLAEGLVNIDGIIIDPAAVQTNIVVFQLAHLNSIEFVDRLAADGVKAVPFGGQRVRMVTHWGIERQDLRTTLDIVHRILG